MASKDNRHAATADALKLIGLWGNQLVGVE